MAKVLQFEKRFTPRSSSHREGAEDYRGTLYRQGSWRVAICRDGVQYLLQRQRPGKAGVGGGWDSQRYCATRAALILDWHALTGDLGIVLIELLPERAKMIELQSTHRSERGRVSAGHS